MDRLDTNPKDCFFLAMSNSSGSLRFLILITWSILSIIQAQFSNIGIDTGVECNGNCACSDACDCVPLPEYSDPPMCPESELTLEDGVEIAWKFAPVLYHHPLDWSHLQDPLDWIQQAILFGGLSTEPALFQELDLFNDSLIEQLSDTWFSLLSNKEGTGIKENVNDLFLGDPFVDGESTARVFFTAFESDNFNLTKEHNAWVFTYHYFYPFDGCTTYFLSTNFGDAPLGQRSFLCPIGAHEGDWEHVTVYVCKADQKIRQIQYSQHSWVTRYDCPDGECPSMEEVIHASGEVIQHPVTYAAMFSHANYPYPSDTWIYFLIKEIAFPQLEGIYVTDWVRKDPNKKFIPNEQNVVYLPKTEEIDLVIQDEIWGLYTGAWGTQVTARENTIACINDDFTDFVVCDPNPLIRLILFQVTGSAEYVDTDQATWMMNLSESGKTLSGEIRGPLTRDYAHNYIAPTYAALWNETRNVEDVVCPAILLA